MSANAPARLRTSAVLILAAVLAEVAMACPLCGPASPTFAEQIAGADVVVFASFSEGEMPDHDRDFSGVTHYTIMDIVKASESSLEVQQSVSLPRYRHGELGDLVMMFGTRVDDTIRWNEVLDITPAVKSYLDNSPPLDVPTTQRLTYFIENLEHSEPLIATDAFSEFAVAPYEDIVPLRPLMKPQQLRDWIANANEPADRCVRVGLYGLMLGISGRADDAEFLASKILDTPDEYKFGLDGLTGGYLLLDGEAGLKELSTTLFVDPDATPNRLFPILEAMRFAWIYAEDQVPRQSLRDAMRTLLRRPDLADLVLVDLARWKDWEAMEQIVLMYDQPEYEIPAVKRAILRYLLVAEQSASANETGTVPAHVSRARDHLNRLRERDPKTARAAERYFFE